MSYASLEEAYGGVSGSTMLNTPPTNMSNSVHPMHQQQIRRNNPNPGPNIENFSNNEAQGNRNRNSNSNSNITINKKYNQQPPQAQPQTNPQQSSPHQGGPYKCKYGDGTCAQAFQNNQQFNEAVKQVVAGMQPFLPNSPSPQNYTYAMQYPSYPWSKQAYQQYGNDVSKAWYNEPWMSHPNLAHQIQNYQMRHPGNYNVPIERPYRPPSYGQLYEEGIDEVYRNPNRRRRRENFGNMNSDSNMIRNSLVILVFFLIALATLLVVFVIATKSN
jgi:hypothetical protein